MSEVTWEEIPATEDQPQRSWQMYQDGRKIEGAYVLELGEEDYELHFPKLRPSSVASLAAAKHLLEGVPIPQQMGITIGRRAKDNEPEGFLTVSESAEMAGISRPRFNALVANGVVAAKRVDGVIMVSVASTKAYMAKAAAGTAAGTANNAKVPVGRFGNTFVQLFPDVDVDAFILAEVDQQDDDQVITARAFVDTIREDNENPAGARIIDYKSAMRLKRADQRLPFKGSMEIPFITDLPLEALAEAREPLSL